MPTYLTVNAHGGGGTRAKEFAEWYNDVDPDIGLVSELLKNVAELRKTHQVITGHGSRGKEDCGIVIRRGHSNRVKHTRVMQLTQDLDTPIAPDRHLINMRLTHRSVYSIHANAVIQEPDTGAYRDNASAGQWYQGMRDLNRYLRTDIAHQRHLILGGDLNWRWRDRNGREPIYRSPEWLARRNNLSWFSHQVMWFMYSEKHFNAVKEHVIPGNEVPVGINEEKPHPALLVTLQPR